MVADGAWDGTVTTEDNVTTVVNQTGSVWGGTAQLIEEASIGVDAGDEPYLLGDVNGVVAHDGRIYVLDGQGSAGDTSTAVAAQLRQAADESLSDRSGRLSTWIVSARSPDD